MKALHLLKTSIGATWALRQMRELVKLGIEVHVALPPDGPLLPRYEAAGVVVHPVQFDFPLRSPHRFPEMANGLRKLVAFVQPDIIHSHFVGTTLTMRLALGRTCSIPRVFQVPGPLHLEHPFFRWVEILSAGAPDFWIGSCAWTCERYRQSGIRADRIFLSFYGVDLDEFANQNKGRLRQELGIDTSIRIVGMVAYMYAPKRYLGQKRGLKGHEDLIDALALCLKTEPNVMGVFIGGAWNNALRYERRVHEYGRTRCGDRAVFLGTRADVADLYQDFDVAVHPSHSENLGGAVESLLSGVPTIATDIGGFPDVITPGITGWLVPAGNPPELAAAILSTLGDTDYAHQVAQTGQKRCRQLLDVRRTAQQVYGIYEKILY